MDSHDKLDEFLKPYEWNWNLPRFVTEFFGHDRTWVAGALKAVLPDGKLTDEEIYDAAYSLWGYAQHHKLNFEVLSTQTLDAESEDPTSE